MNHYFMVIDLDATCCDKHTFYRHEIEDIEIGAVILNRQPREIDSEFQQFMKPVINPILTELWINSTTIYQHQVDAAPQFSEVMSKLAEWMNSFPNDIFCSWGNYDKMRFLQDCRFHNVPYPFGAVDRNIKKEFSEYLGVYNKFGMEQALLAIFRDGIKRHTSQRY
ncbi:3'-5' exonuclease [Trichormus azollae HNT15244]